MRIEQLISIRSSSKVSDTDKTWESIDAGFDIGFGVIGMVGGWAGIGVATTYSILDASSPGGNGAKAFYNSLIGRKEEEEIVSQ